ncbi:MAG: peptidoglycan bridge formation glycyltransferase FemA/FemB family protein [Candidatus Sungbacteria bacterium]|nr:peptidoglycan bridge formation glycyltransferase FemA/FemB family protein [Candidatus Sungbacteria bacterium]
MSHQHTIRNVTVESRDAWNRFLGENYPPIGAFMQTWEWGAFQESLGRKVGRFFLTDGGENAAAAFTLVRHSLPLGLSYGYVPRGPVMKKHDAEGEASLGLLKTIRAWARENFPRFVFLRLEPPLFSSVAELGDHGFHIPPYYVQPRHNLAVALDKTEDEIVQGFHPSTRSNIRRAERRGVTVEMKRMSEDDYNQFFLMARDTTLRNSGKNTYPSPDYFRSLVKTIPPLTEIYNPEQLSLGIFYGYQYGQPAAAHFVLFFGKTATYLYGASFSDRLRSKVSTYLHWAAMREAKRRGLEYYDIGGIDEARWPTLTAFKRQFRGNEFHYIGNVDIPLRPAVYHVYNLFRKFRGGSFGL